MLEDKAIDREGKPSIGQRLQQKIYSVLSRSGRNRLNQELHDTLHMKKLRNRG